MTQVRKKKDRRGRVFTIRLDPLDERALARVAFARKVRSRGAVIRDLLHEEVRRVRQR